MDTETTYSRPPKGSGLSAATLLVALVAGVLAVALIAVLVLYNQSTADLDGSRAQIATLNGNINNLETQVSAGQTRVSQLETELAAEKASITNLEGELAAAQAAVIVAQADTATAETEVRAAEARVTSLQAELTIARANLASLEAQLTAANAQIATLQAASLQITQLQAANLTLTADLDKLKSPRHFNNLNELQLWLAIDDTNYAYPSSNSIERAFILQVKALREGLILSANIQPAGLGGIFLMAMNYAVVGGTQVYRINPDNDELVLMYPNVSPPVNLSPSP